MIAAPEPAMGEGRSPGLDGWRAALMLGGLLVHASVLQEDRPLFDVVGFVSAHFRMGAFMVISGLLAGMATARRDAREWVGRRAARLAMPTLTGLAVTGSTLAFLARISGPTGRALPNPIGLYHLWFLIALLLYLPLVLAFQALDRRFAFVDRLDRLVGSVAHLQMVVLGLTGVASGVLMGGASFACFRLGSLASIPDHTRLLLAYLPSVLGYAPLFLMGLVMGCAPRLRSMLLSNVQAPAAALVALLLLEAFLSSSGEWSSGPGGTILLVAGMAVSPVLAAALVLRSALTIQSVSPLVRRLSDASLTMYIVHFPLLVALNTAFAQLAWNVYVEYALAVAIGGTLSYAFHQNLVRRSSLLMLLFGGRSTGGSAGRRGRVVDTGAPVPGTAARAN